MPRSRPHRPKVKDECLLPCLASVVLPLLKGLRSGRPFNKGERDLKPRDGQQMSRPAIENNRLDASPLIYPASFCGR